MATKFGEAHAGGFIRERTANGNHWGPMYYIKNGRAFKVLEMAAGVSCFAIFGSSLGFGSRGIPSSPTRVAAPLLKAPSALQPLGDGHRHRGFGGHWF